MSKHTKEYNHAYNSGFSAGQADAARQLKENQDDLDGFGLAELGLLLSRKEGYARVGADRSGLYWARYKWTTGSLAGFYTFGSGPTLGHAVAQVCEHVHEVESGKRKPTADTGYKRR